MLLKTLLRIFQNDRSKEVLTVVVNVAMAISIIMALLMMDAKGIDFIYANF